MRLIHLGDLRMKAALNNNQEADKLQSVVFWISFLSLTELKVK
jgi:hypothetical protein